MQMMNKRTEGKIPTHYGIKDYYKYYKSTSESPVDSKTYASVIDVFNSGIVDLIIEEGLDYTPIKIQHTFTVRKVKRIPRIENGKLVNTLPVDYKATNQLWANNAEAKENKILIRHLNSHSSKCVFRIKALKTGYNYTNRIFYLFKPCRSFQRNLAKRIFDSEKDPYDAYTLY